MVDSTCFGMRWAGLVLAGAFCCALGACGVPTSQMTFELRDGPSGMPIEGAGVEADSLALGPSLQLTDVVDQAMGKRASLSTRALTDERGRVTLEVVPERAVRVMALVPGQPPGFVLIDQPLPTPWLRMTTDPGMRPVEVRATWAR